MQAQPWDLKSTRWFHAVNTPTLLADAIAALDAQASTAPLTDGTIPVVGIEADIRLSPPGALPSREPVMRHDPFSADSDAEGVVFTLWEFFHQLTTTSHWFLTRQQQQQQRCQHDAPSSTVSSAPPCRLILKLDVKDPRAARAFTKHVAAWPSARESALVFLCEVLGNCKTDDPGQETELMVWWNADVCASDSQLAVDAKEAMVPGSPLPHEAEKSLALNERFIDLAIADVVTLVTETVRAFPPSLAQRMLGLSLGWVLAPPVALGDSVMDAYYTERDGQRMQHLVTALGERPARLVTYPVLYEAIFPSSAALAQLHALAGDSAFPAAASPIPDRNEHGIRALQHLLRHTRHTCFPESSEATSTGADDEANSHDSAEVFVTLWKVMRSPARSEAAREDCVKASAVFPFCTVDGEI